MLKVSSILMAVCIFLTCILTCSISAYASSIGVNFVITFITEFCIDSLKSYHDNLSKRLEAARSYFFSYLTSNKYGYSGEIFSSNDKFDENYLKFYFDHYYNVVFKNHSDEYDSEGDIFLASVGFPNVKFSLSERCFYSSQMIGDEYFIEEDIYDYGLSLFKNYYQSFLARYILAQGGEATDPNPGKSGLEIAPGYVTSEEFKSELDRLNSLYTPKGNDLFLNSYRTDTYYHTFVKGDSHSCQYYNSDTSSSSSTDLIYPVTLYQNPSEHEGLNDLWCLPFYKSESGDMYYTDYLFHLYYTFEDDPNVDTALVCDVYNYNTVLGWIKNDSLSDIYYEFSQSLGQTKPYQVRMFVNSRVEDAYNRIDAGSSYLSVVVSEIDYSKFYAQFNKPKFGSAEMKYYSPDRSKSLFLNSSHYEKTASSVSEIFVPLDFYGQKTDGNNKYYHVHDPNYTANPNKNNDYGFICSESMIDLHWDFDTSKIQDGQIVEVNGGDTIYNYNITNPSTGQTSTVNEYITNNYTYIEESGGEQGSGGTGGTGGSVSGNVDVSGDVGVHGDINVDVNINQGGTGVNPNDFITGDVDLGGYYDDAVSMASGVNGIMQKFFDFLPAEILSLLGILIAVAIVCRLLGR